MIDLITTSFVLAAPMAVMFFLSQLFIMWIYHKRISRQIGEIKIKKDGAIQHITDQIFTDFDCQDTHLKNIEDKIDELRLQVGIIKGCMGQPTSVSYQGAKRGPKPKPVVQVND